MTARPEGSGVAKTARQNGLPVTGELDRLEADVAEACGFEAVPPVLLRRGAGGDWSPERGTIRIGVDELGRPAERLWFLLAHELSHAQVKAREGHSMQFWRRFARALKRAGRLELIKYDIGYREGALRVAHEDDSVDEPDETFTVTLSDPSAGATIGDGSATVTIVDNDLPLPVLSIADVAVGEGDGEAVLTITMDSTSDGVVTVVYSTSDGTATAPADYTETSTTATIPAGATSTTATVPIVDDALGEVDETFTVTLAQPSGGAIISETAGSATVTIVDDEPPPLVLTIADVTVGEGDGQAVLTIALDQETTTAVTFQYDTSDGTAKAGEDYTAMVGATSTIPVGATSTTIPILDDTVSELDETFTVTLSNPLEGAIVHPGAGSATVTIIDNEPPPPATARIEGLLRLPRTHSPPCCG